MLKFFLSINFWPYWVFVAVCGLLLLVVHGFLIAMASLVAEHGLQGTWASVVVVRGLSSCGLVALRLVGS